MLAGSHPRPRLLRWLGCRFFRREFPCPILNFTLQRSRANRNRARAVPPRSVDALVTHRGAIGSVSPESELDPRGPGIGDGQERTGLILLAHGGRTFLVTESMAQIFVNQARRIISLRLSGLVVLAHSGGTDLLHISSITPFTVSVHSAPAEEGHRHSDSPPTDVRRRVGDDTHTGGKAKKDLGHALCWSRRVP